MNRAIKVLVGSAMVIGALVVAASPDGTRVTNPGPDSSMSMPDGTRVTNPGPDTTDGTRVTDGS